MQTQITCMSAPGCQGKMFSSSASLAPAMSMVCSPRVNLFTDFCNNSRSKAAGTISGSGFKIPHSAAHLSWTRSCSEGRQGIERRTRATLQQENRTFFGQGAKNGSAILTVEHPSDHIGFGNLLDHGSFFRERFVIRFCEVTNGGTITLETLASLLQEAATNHVIAIDFGFLPGSSNFDGSITVTTRMHVEVDQYPAWRDLLEIDTWFQREGKNSVRRDWTVKDVKTGKHIAFATSTWVLMNSHTRRLTKLTDDKWAELEPHVRHPPKNLPCTSNSSDYRWALSEERRDVSSAKIAKLGDDVSFKVCGQIASEKDTDMNQHVNNIRYMGWMLESIPEDVKSTHEVSKITLEYRQEASKGQAVDSLAEMEEPVGKSTRRFTHLIKTSEVGKEINRGRTVWRPLPASLNGAK